jgi:hypothetical protein
MHHFFNKNWQDEVHHTASSIGKIGKEANALSRKNSNNKCANPFAGLPLAVTLCLAVPFLWGCSSFYMSRLLLLLPQIYSIKWANQLGLRCSRSMHAHKKNKEQGTCVLALISDHNRRARKGAASTTCTILAFEKRRDFDRATFAIKMTIKVTARSQPILAAFHSLVVQWKSTASAAV